MLKRIFSLFLSLVLLISAVPVPALAAGNDGGNIVVGGACVHPELEHIEAGAAGCTQVGWVEHWHCPDCGLVWIDEDLTETAETAGDLELEPLGHNWGGWEVSKAATCTAAGEESRSCSRCGQTETRAAAALGHSWSDWAVTKEPT